MIYLLIASMTNLWEWRNTFLDVQTWLKCADTWTHRLVTGNQQFNNVHKWKVHENTTKICFKSWINIWIFRVSLFCIIPTFLFKLKNSRQVNMYRTCTVQSTKSDSIFAYHPPTHLVQARKMEGEDNRIKIFICYFLSFYALNLKKLGY